MKKKLNQTFILSVIALCIITLVPMSSFAGTSTKEGLVNYTVNIETSGKGTLYWDYGKNMEFFLANGCETYNINCKIKNNTNYKFSKVFDRGILAKPDEGCYFSGFYDKNGKKISMTKTNIDIVRVTVDGLYYFDYVDAYNNPKFENYTKAAYEKEVKAYLKSVYGTTRYKVMEQTILYELPKKDADYYAKFKAKTTPKISYDKTITKTYGNSSFYLVSNLPSSYQYTFKSSNPLVLAVNKTTGYATIKSPGAATVTLVVEETEKTLSTTCKIKVTVKPKKVTNVSAVQKSDTRLSLTWKGSSKNSGYEIQVSNNKAFLTILAKKTVWSGSASSTTVSLKTELFNNYARIRAYKKSGGKKIYGAYTVVKISR